MGGEIFKNSLRKLEDKSIQKFQRNISLETRQNSLSNDINFLKNNSTLADENLSQRLRKREINNFAIFSNAFLRKIESDKRMLAAITHNTPDKFKDIISKTKNVSNWTKEHKLIIEHPKFEANAKISYKKQVNALFLKVFQINETIDSNITKFNFHFNTKILIFGKDFYIIIFILVNFYSILIDNIQFSFAVFDPGISAHTIKFKLFLHIYILYINSKNKFNSKIMDIIYNKRIIMLLDADIYTEFENNCNNLNNYADNEEINTTRLRWLAFLMIFTDIFGYKIYFNEKFGRLKLNFYDKYIIIPIPNENCILSAYIDVKQIRNISIWDSCNEENIISIARNLN